MESLLETYVSLGLKTEYSYVEKIVHTVMMPEIIYWSTLLSQKLKMLNEIRTRKAGIYNYSNELES